MKEVQPLLSALLAMKCNSLPLFFTVAAGFLAVGTIVAVPVPTGANLGKEVAPLVQQAEKAVEKVAESTSSSVKYVKPTVHDLYHDDSFYQHMQSVSGQGRKSLFPRPLRRKFLP